MKYGFQIARRFTDDLKYVGSSSLLLQGFGKIACPLAQLVEQPGILNGDYGLSRKILYQSDLLVCEGPDLLSIDGDAANQLVLL